MSSATNLYPAPGAAPSTGGQPLVSVHPAQQIANAVQGSTAGGAGVSVPTAGSGTGIAQAVAGKPGKLAAFEGFLKKAGHIAGVVLTDIVRYLIPVASVVALADPAVAPAVEAFTASVKLVQATVISVQQKWAAGRNFSEYTEAGGCSRDRRATGSDYVCAGRAAGRHGLRDQSGQRRGGDPERAAGGDSAGGRVEAQSKRSGASAPDLLPEVIRASERRRWSSRQP